MTDVQTSEARRKIAQSENTMSAQPDIYLPLSPISYVLPLADIYIHPDQSFGFGISGEE
jgi:hypothetical protein